MFHEHINNTVLYVKKREKNNPAFVYITQMSIEKKIVIFLFRISNLISKIQIDLLYPLIYSNEKSCLIK